MRVHSSGKSGSSRPPIAIFSDDDDVETPTSLEGGGVEERMRLPSSGRDGDGLLSPISTDGGPFVIRRLRDEVGASDEPPSPLTPHSELWISAHAFIRSQGLSISISGMDSDELQGLTPEVGAALGWDAAETRQLIDFIARR